jgi:uncharacterized protein (DUF3820 family)
VPIFHDAIKCGWEGSTYTVHEHPMLAGTWVRESNVEHDIDEKVKEAIARMCERHSGEWTTSKKSKVVLPEPENAMEVMIHECDILSSRNNIDMRPPEYLNDIFDDLNKPLEFDENYTMTFGKYNGRRLIDVYKSDPGYLSWCEENLNKNDLKQMIKAMKECLKNKENE